MLNNFVEASSTNYKKYFLFYPQKSRAEGACGNHPQVYPTSVKKETVNVIKKKKRREIETRRGRQAENRCGSAEESSELGKK